MKQIKLEKNARVAQILAAALDLAARVGYANVTRDAVAQRLGIASSLIPYHIGTMTAFRRAMVREAIRTECLPVIAQAVAAKDKHAQKAPEELRTRALQSLAA